MSYLGDIVPGQTLNFKFTTVTSSGAPVVLTGSPSLVAWKDASTTSSTAGLTLTASFGGITGSNHVNVNTGADGTFYSAGSDFMITIAAGTAGGVSVVGYDVGEFSINNRSALRPTTASRTLNVSAAGTAGVNWGNVENPTTTVSLSNTTMSATQIAASVTGAVGSVTGNVGGNVAGSVGSVTGNVGGNIGGSVLGSVVGDVGGISAAGIDAASFAAGAIDSNALAASAVAEIWGQAMTELGATPAPNASALAALTFLFMAIRNERVTTTSSDTISNDAGTPIATAPISDSGTVFTKGEYA